MKDQVETQPLLHGSNDRAWAYGTAGRQNHPHESGGMEGYPLSFAQERLWFFDQLVPASKLYNMPLAFHLCGPLDLPALVDALRELRTRHAICHTRFVERNGAPVQVIDPSAGASLPVVSLEHFPAAARAPEVDRLAAEEAARPFDLGCGPLLRTTLLRIGPDEHVLLITCHHIIADGWSVGILLSELEVLYAAFRRGSSVFLPEPPIQYVDYAVWQRQTVSGEALEQQLKHWTERLRGAPAVLNLPYDHPRPSQPVFRGAQRSRQSSAALSAKVLALAQRARVTPFMALLGVFQVLLAHYTGQFDVPVLCAMANRERPETQELVGPMMNLVVLRTILANNPKAIEVLEQVRDVLFDSYEHQDVPFEMLVQHLEGQRDSTRHPLAQVAFSMTHSEGAALDLRGLTVTRFFAERGVARVDLTLFVEIRQDGLFSSLEYNSDLFDPATIDRMLKDFEFCLTEFAADPERRILAIPLFESDVAASLGLPRSRVQRLSPLTPAQRDNHIAGQLTSDPRLLRVAASLPLGPGISPDRWRDAMAHAMSRDDIARTRFVVHNHQPYQFIDPELTVPHQFVDLITGARDLNDAIEDEVARPFDIEQGPLYRSTLVRTFADEYVAILTWHHLVSDGFSSHVAFARAWEAYAALQQHRALPQGEVSSFYDFVGESLASFDTPATRAFWAAETAEVTALQCHPNPKNEGTSRAVDVAIEGDDLDSIREFCSKYGCSLATYLLAAYGLTIQKYCNPAGDYMVSHLLHGRSQNQRETLGCFYQVLPLVFRRTVQAGGVTPADYVNSVSEARKRVAGHKKISVAQQKATIAETSRPRFFYNFFNFLAIERPGGQHAGHINFCQHFAPDEVHLLVRDLGQRVEMVLNFHDSSFDDYRFAERIRRCAHQMAVGTKDVGTINILLEDDRQADKAVVSAVLAPGAQNFTHDHIAAQARRTPDALAVSSDETLTYQQLNDRADRWAQRLRALGVGPETIVAMLAPRNANFLVAMLAIFKAGGALLPLDPAQPSERIARILRHSASSFLLAPASFDDLVERAQEGIGVNERPAGMRMEDLGGGGVEPRRNLLQPQSLSYVIYTSGSTGDPKGAMITHHGMQNHLQCKVEALGVTSQDVLAQTSSQSVDVCVWQFLTALLVGGSVCIVNDDVARDPIRLLRAVSESRITILEIVPSMLRAMLVELKESNGSRPSLSTLRWLVVNGEVLPPELCREWFELYPDVPLVNAYGPTECSDDVTHYYLRKASDAAFRRVPVGDVLPNLRVHVLDPAWQPLPLTAAGHLHIGGAGVGRGYLNDPVRTAENFIPDPFSTVPGERLYRTGDLGRCSDEGLIDFLSRIDFQVKIRGHRIEVGEIEAALLRQPDVAQTVVTTYMATQGELRLAAYIVPRQHPARAISEIISLLRKTIPEYMVPAAFIMLDSMPLLPSGKINRKALPPPEDGTNAGKTSDVAPRTPTEELIASMWMNILGVSKVGVHDNFFQLGGHSLLATQVASRLRRTYDIDLPLQRVFDAPTVSELAVVVDQLRVNSDDIASLITEIKNMPRDLLQQELNKYRSSNSETNPATGNEAKAA